jgi:hypothetical protein
MEKAKCHLAALSGALTLSKLKSYFKRKDGFVVAYRGMDAKTTFSWREVLLIKMRDVQRLCSLASHTHLMQK